ncbi:MAG: hypothetical protein GX442_16660 [Candidatus Riflebacteria bacterium]|nr:hypothetical protein [Candidatus Riflebacteria bacterium]
MKHPNHPRFLAVVAVLLLLAAPAGHGQSPALEVPELLATGSLLPGDPIPTGTVADPTQGSLKVIVESVYERTPRQYSALATRVELWIAERRLAALDKDEAGVSDLRHRRLFEFQPILMPPGYRFLTVRAYREGPLSRDGKWKGKTVQFGIHAGRETRLFIRLPFHVW